MQMIVAARPSNVDHCAIEASVGGGAPKEEQVEISVENLADGIEKVTLTGSLDVSAAQEIEREFSAAARSGHHVVVDLSQVRFLSSQGIRALMINAKAVEAKGRRMVLVAPPPQVEHVLHVAGIDQLIPLYHEVDRAVATLQP